MFADLAVLGARGSNGRARNSRSNLGYDLRAEAGLELATY